MPKEPISNNHWSDAVRSEYGNYMVMSSNTFDTRYGDGASAIAGQLMSDPATFAKWQEGLTSVDKIQEAGGYWSQQAYTTKYSGLGSITLNGVDYKIQPATGGVNNKWISVSGGRLSGGGANAASSQGGERDWLAKTQIGMESYGLVNSSKEQLITLAAKTDASINKLQYVKVVKVVGKALVVAGAAATIYEAYDDAFNKGNYYSAGTRLSVAGKAAGAAFIPFVGWGIAGGIGLADAIWGDQFYGWVELNLTK